jgi:NADH-quinone oxidoreductase subunit A
LNVLAATASPLWPIVFYFVAVLVIVAAIFVLSWALGQRHKEPQTGEPYESGIVSVGSARLRLSVKYYLVAMLFVVFDVETVFLVAWAIALRDAGWNGFLEALVFITILVVALVYLWRQGALDWTPRARRAHKRQ